MANKIVKFKCTVNSSSVQKTSKAINVHRQSISITINSREVEAKKETYRRILSIYRKDY